MKKKQQTLRLTCNPSPQSVPKQSQAQLISDSDPARGVAGWAGESVKKEEKKQKLSGGHFRGKHVTVARERQSTFFIGEHRAYHWRHVTDTAQLKGFLVLRRSGRRIFTAPANLSTARFASSGSLSLFLRRPHWGTRPCQRCRACCLATHVPIEANHEFPIDP